MKKVTDRMIELSNHKLIELLEDNQLGKDVTNQKNRIKKDERHSKFFYYQNGFVEVTKDGYEFKDYSQLNGLIFENQVLERNFVERDKIEESYIERFFKNVSGLRNKETGTFSFDEERILSLKTITGYNLHNHTETNQFVTLVTDIVNDEWVSNGMTGKSLWANALGQMLNANRFSRIFLQINGHKFNPRDEYRYRDAANETSLIHIADLWYKFNLETIFDDITNGIEVKKPYTDKYTIHAKIVLSSSQPVKVNDETAKDRVKIFKFSDYYNLERNPLTLFRHQFFTDWDPEEWSRFDMFMISCCQEYFKYGVL